MSGEEILTCTVMEESDTTTNCYIYASGVKLGHVQFETEPGMLEWLGLPADSAVLSSFTNETRNNPTLAKTHPHFAAQGKGIGKRMLCKSVHEFMRLQSKPRRALYLERVKQIRSKDERLKKYYEDLGFRDLGFGNRGMVTFFNDLKATCSTKPSRTVRRQTPNQRRTKGTHIKLHRLNSTNMLEY